MGGSVPFEVALAARLDLIKPSRSDFASCLEAHPPPLTNGKVNSRGLAPAATGFSTTNAGIAELVEALHAKGTDVYLVSGGFRLVGDKSRAARFIYHSISDVSR